MRVFNQSITGTQSQFKNNGDLLGEDPDTQEALEFLCLAEGGEVTHYEVLASVAKDVTNKKFGVRVRAILKEEQGHLELCTKLAKNNAASE
jgi:hypothetical protein